MLVLKVKVISIPYVFQVLYVLCFSRPIYQVSVYRTIGPLVFIMPHENTDITYYCLKFGAFIMAAFDAMII